MFHTQFSINYVFYQYEYHSVNYFGTGEICIIKIYVTRKRPLHLLCQLSPSWEEIIAIMEEERRGFDEMEALVLASLF
jgi:hypothetical protein